MKRLLSLLFILVLATPNFSFNRITHLEANMDGAKIEVYYFHMTRRCATCKAVESESKKALEALYPQKIKNSEITFQSVNIEEDENKELTESLKISGQTLLFIMGDKKVDLTNDGFMYARTNPEKLQAKIKETIESLLEE